MRLKIRNYFPFYEAHEVIGPDLVRPEAWDRARLSSTRPDFALPEDRVDYERLVDSETAYEERARRLDHILDEFGAASVASYGVGRGVLERWLSRLSPDRALTITEYTPASLARLGQLFPEARTEVFDLRSESPLDADVHLMHRLDTELDDPEWREVFARYAEERVIFIAASQLSVWLFLWQARVRLQRRRTFAGWLRTHDAVADLWSDTHVAESIPGLDLDGWVLVPR